MAEESQDGQEKTEEPSQRKLEKAAEDGKVLSSIEAFVFTSMFAGFMLMFITPMFLAPLLDDLGAMFHLNGRTICELLLPIDLQILFG